MKKPVDRIFLIFTLVSLLAIAIVDSYKYEVFLGWGIAYWKEASYLNFGLVIGGWAVWQGYWLNKR